MDLSRELPCATGVIDLATFLGALVKIGYDGPVRAGELAVEVAEGPTLEAFEEPLEARLRAHLRLFRTGVEGWTLGGAHFEMQIPGTIPAWPKMAGW